MDSFLQSGKLDFELVQPKFLSAQFDQSGQGGSRVVAPMPGVLEKVLVKPGDQVKKGDSLAPCSDVTRRSLRRHQL